MNNKVKKALSLAAKILLVFIFLFVAVLTILSAAGYKIELASKEVVLTSMIAVKATPRNATLFIDGVQKDSLYTASWRVGGLTPGKYKIRVEALGYHTWEQDVEIKAGETSINEDVTLFLVEPTIEELSADTSGGVVSKLNNATKNEDIVVSKDNEIFYNGILVTRLLKPINNVQIYPDEMHMSYISEGKLHIVDIDGSNDIVLISMPDDAPYLFLNGGTQVVYQTDDKIQKATIR